MPIYAYKCDSCGFAKDVLQKLSDAPLTDCPSCGAAAFRKQLTAAGFQLKGSGWYATDFKEAGKKPASASGDDKSGSGGDSQTETNSEAKSDGKSDGKGDAKGNGKGNARGDGKSDSKGDSKNDGKNDNKPEPKKAEPPAVKKPDAAPATGSGA